MSALRSASRADQTSELVIRCDVRMLNLMQRDARAAAFALFWTRDDDVRRRCMHALCVQ
jgi:hypothetical protein